MNIFASAVKGQGSRVKGQGSRVKGQGSSPSVLKFACIRQPLKQNNKGYALIMVLMAGAIGTIVSLAMIKNILFFQKYVRSAEEDLTVVQTTQEIISQLINAPPCAQEATPCTYKTTCTNTFLKAQILKIKRQDHHWRPTQSL